MSQAELDLSFRILQIKTNFLLILILGKMIRLAGKIWSSYITVLNKHPMRVQIIQTGVIMASGDIIAQLYLEKIPPRHLDIKRTARFGFIGMTFVAPVVRGWYLTMERLLGSSVTLLNTLRKVGLDQLAFAPIFTVGILSCIGKLQGQSFSEIKLKLERELKDIVLTGWTIWPAAQIINFYFVPFLVRPLVVSAVALFWNTYLAWKANKSVNVQRSA